MIEQIKIILKSIRPELDFTSSNNFFEDGLLDSFELVLMVTELEDTFKIVIDGVDIIPENFKNINSIVSLINSSKKR
ncbi:MAG TPA: acyl carrier protein [Bacteroidales bacterium]|nr:acyl carrier protein [Bacteroidales bacterium]